MREDLVTLKKSLATLAECVECLISLDDRDQAGEDVPENEINEVMGRFLMGFINLQTAINKLTK